MKVKFTKVPNWNGGNWKYDGLSSEEFYKLHGKRPDAVVGMKASVILNGVEYPGEVVGFNTVHGEDHDHGHTYSWSYEDPMIQMEISPFPLPADNIWGQGAEIILEVPDGSN